MPVKSQHSIEAQLEENARRMKEVREKAEALKEIGLLGEPETPPQTVTLIQPRQSNVQER